MTASVTYRWLSCTGHLYSKYKAPLPRICLVTVILQGDRYILGHYICTGLTVPLRKRTTRRAVNPIFKPVCATYSPSSRYKFPVRKLQLSKFRPKNWLNLHAHSLGDQWLQFTLASIFPLRWVVCCVFTDCGLCIINTDFEPKLLFSNIRPILFKFCDLQYIQYNMELRYILILAKTRKTTLES